MMRLRENGDHDERDRRMITLYDDEALELMQNWWSGQGDPLYAIYSMGGQHEAWIFEKAVSNLEGDIGRVKKIGRNRYQLGRGTFTKKEIDELHIMRDALQMALDDAGHDGPQRELEMDEAALPHNRYYRKPSRDRGRHVMDFATLAELVQHERDRNGATHVSVSGDKVYIYYPGRGGERSVGQAWQERGYWHSSAPSARFTGRLRPDAVPVEQFLADGGRRRNHTVRDYLAVDHTGRTIAGPFKSYSDAKKEADRVRGYVKFTMEEGSLYATSEARGRRAKRTEWTRQNTKINTWFERDRAYVVLETLDGQTIIEWWDDGVHQAVEDGFLNPSDWHGSAVEYANHVGALAVSEGSNPPPHVMPPGRGGHRMLPPGPLPTAPGHRRVRPPRAPFTRRRSGGISGPAR